MGTRENASGPYGRWQSFWFSRETSLPGLTNHFGSLQAEADPVAVKHAVFPPVSAAEETTGMTWLDGALFAASGQPVRARWSLAVLERRATFQNWTLDTRTAMACDSFCSRERVDRIVFNGSTGCGSRGR